MVDPIIGLLRVIEVLERLGVPYCVGGSIASSIYGIRRTTLDADIVADLKLEQVAAFAAGLDDEFYRDPDMMRDAIARRATFNVIHYATGFKVDIFIPKNRAFDQQQLQRRVERHLDQAPDRPIYLSSPEDIVLAKLEWYRMGNEISDRQWQDVQSVLRSQQEQLDLSYLHRWAAELGLSDLLQRALGEAGVH